MELLASIDLFDAKVARQIALSDSNQRTVIEMANFHLSRGFVFKQRGNLHLHAACRRKKNQVVEFLVKKGANVEFQNRLGHSALNVAMLQLSIPSVVETLQTCKLFDLLVRLGASLSSTDRRGGTVLHQWACDVKYTFASRSYHSTVLTMLLKHDVPADIVDDCGNTALMHAAAHRSVRFMMLLEATVARPNTNLNQKNIFGQTCAHLLVSQSDYIKLNVYGVDDAQYAHALKKLLGYGISLHITDRTGDSVIKLILTERGNNDALRKVLYDHTQDCMLAFLMGTHLRLGQSSLVGSLDDIGMDLILINLQELLKSIANNCIHSIDSVQFQNSLAPVAADEF